VTHTLIKLSHDRPQSSQWTSLKQLDAIWILACPARFERATYALEAVKMRLNNSKNNELSLARPGVA